MIAAALALVAAAGAAPIIGEAPAAYPTLVRNAPVVFNTTVSRAYPAAAPHGGLLIVSPANDLFDHPLPGPDHAVLWLKNPDAAWAGAAPDAAILTTELLFPNTALSPPADWAVVGRTAPPAVICGGRFPAGPIPALPGEVILLVDGEHLTISGPPGADNSWFYFDLRFVDLTGDGLSDILITRQTDLAPLEFRNQLVFFAHPGLGNEGNGPWPMVVLVDDEVTGASTAFDIADVDGDGVFELAAVEFWASRMSIYWTETSWADPSGIQRRTLAEGDEIGNAYGIVFTDANGDGNLDVIATNHANLGGRAMIVAVELPAGFKNPAVALPLRVLDDDFPDRWKESAQAVGFVYALPVAGLKPLIFLTGDGAGAWWLMEPVSQDPTDWRYERTVLDSNACDFIAPTQAGNVMMVGCLGERTLYSWALL